MTSEPRERGLFEPVIEPEEQDWSYVHRPVERPQDTPIYEQLVAEATYPQLAEEPESDELDPLVGTS